MRRKKVQEYPILEELQMFLEEDEMQIKTMILSNSESMFIKQYLYERDVQVEVENEQVLSTDRISFTLRKM